MSQRKKAVKSQVKTNQKTNTFEFGVFNLAIPEHIEEPLDLSRVRTKFIPFGTNNLFPQYLAELKRKSSTHRSVLAQKAVFTSGAKFVTNNEEIKDYIKDVNADGNPIYISWVAGGATNSQAQMTDDFFGGGDVGIALTTTAV